MVDRRQGERRESRHLPSTSPADSIAERRRNDRRGHPEIDNELRLTSFAIVTLPDPSRQRTPFSL